ncbi:hypothetical protein [Shewanella sp.]|uniref:hypothetical protein n=1 Tax=Shewanella sp. TaxID=50422 RepID=UPI003A979E4F
MNQSELNDESISFVITLNLGLLRKSAFVSVLKLLILKVFCNLCVVAGTLCAVELTASGSIAPYSALAGRSTFCGTADTTAQQL